MYVKVFSSATMGIEAYVMEVELDLVSGMPGMIIVGLPDMAVKESRERVRSAIVNCGYPFPPKKMTLNLAPADIPKEGSALDLPIAITILAGSGIVPVESLEKTLFLGELALDGILRPVRGALPVALDAEQHGFTRLLLPKDNAREAAVVDKIDVFPIGTLTEAVELLNGTSDIQPCKVNAESLFEQAAHYEIDFSEVKGQEHVKRALEVSAAGGHNIIMIGPPGSGKSMLAKRLATILPPISFEEALETTKIHSIHGSLPTDQAIIAIRPFRMPHHSVSDVRQIGGGVGRSESGASRYSLFRQDTGIPLQRPGKFTPATGRRTG